MLTQEYLKSILDYDCETGIFKWKVSNSPRVKIGDITGCLHHTGYLFIRINKKQYLAHRLAWLYVNGNWPKDMIDHIDGIRNNNKISNLRQASRTENQQNSKLSKRNTSGIKGISWHKASKKWQVAFKINGKSKTFGYFNDLELAELVVNEARLKYHGNFARAI